MSITMAQIRKRNQAYASYGAQASSASSANTQRNTSRYNHEAQTQSAENEEKNKKGFLGGLAYAGEKLLLGAVSSLEGFVDYTVGGLSKAFGGDEIAESVFDNDWVNYNHADEWYNPDGGWKFVGDVFSGVGTSLTALGIGGLTGPAAGFITPLIAGVSAAGNATKEAYRETGKLDGEAFAYGALSGATEAALEGITGKLGAGSARIAKSLGASLAKKSGKELAEATVKSTAKKALITMGKDFAGEAFEEGMSEILAPVYQRWTYNPEAENATPGEVLYSALVGGISGAVMNGGQVAIKSTANLASGNKSVKNGTDASIIEIAKNFSAFNEKYDTGYEVFDAIKESYTELAKSLETTGGKVTTAKQKMLLGNLKRLNTIVTLSSFVERSAEHIAENPDIYVDKFNKYGIKDSNGNEIKFTVEELIKDLDTSGDRKKYLKSLRKAITSDTVLAKVAIAEATGNLVMDTRVMSDSTMQGEKIASNADFNYLVENASAEEIAALTELLGIEDWGKITVDEFNAKITELQENGTLKHAVEQMRRIRLAKEAEATTPAKALPHRLSSKLSDGLHHYTSENGANVALMKDGDTYHVYDYSTGNISKSMTMQDVNKVLKAHYTSATVETSSDSKIAAAMPLAEATETKNAVTSINSENMQVTENTDNLSDDVDSYTHEEIISITKDAKNKIANSFEDIVDFVDSSKNGTTNGRLFVGKLKVGTSLKIKNDTQVSTYGKSVVLTSDEIKHIFKQHGNAESEALRGQEAITAEKFIDVLKAIFEPDSVSTEKDSNGVTSLIFTRNNNGNTTAVTIVSEKKKALTLKSARITKKKQYISPLSDVQAPNPTSSSEWSMNTVSVGNENVSTNSISDSSEKINSFEKKTSEKVSSYEKLKAQNAEIAKFAEKNIKDYKKLNDVNRRAVRAVIRQGRAYGLSDADIITIASVSAHSGAKIKFSKADCKRTNKKGETFYVDGFYDGDTDTITVNPEKTRSTDRLLLHELLHDIVAHLGGSKKGFKIYKKLVKQALNNMTEDEQIAIINKYGNEMGESRDSVLIEEILAHYGEAFANKSFFEAMLKERQTLGKRILNFLKSAITDYQGDERLSRSARKFHKAFKKLFDEHSSQNSNTNAYDSNLSLTDGEKRNALAVEDKTQINVDMSETERAKILKYSTITPQEISFTLNAELDWNALERNRKSLVEKPLIKKLQELGCLKKYQTQNVDVDFEFTGKSLRKSMNSQVSDYGGSLGDFTKVVMNMQSLLDASVLLEIHTDKDAKIKKENARLKQVFVLMSAFRENDKITPVQFEIKQYMDNNNRLYLAVALTKIETGVMGDTALQREERTRLLPVSNISIPDLIKKINPRDENFFKYVPNEFLNDAQVEAKQRALSKEAKKYGANSNVRNALPADFDIAKGAISEEVTEKARGVLGTLKDKVKSTPSAILATQIQFTNQQAGIEAAGKALGIKEIEAEVQAVRASRNQAQEMLAGQQWSIMGDKYIKEGDGFYKIIEPIQAKGEEYYEDFQQFLFHRHNIDRMSLEERSIAKNDAKKAELAKLQARLKELNSQLAEINAELKDLKLQKGREAILEKRRLNDIRKSLTAEKNALQKNVNNLQHDIESFKPEENKPVFGKEANGETVAITAEESRVIVEEYLKLHPEFAAEAEKIYTYLDNLQKMRLDAGLINETLYKALKEKYPHYVPTYRDTTKQGTSGISGKYNLSVKKTILKAKGGFEKLTSLDESISRMTEQVITAANVNRLGNTLYDAALSKNNTEFISEISRKKTNLDDFTADEDPTATEKTNQISIYRNGEKVTLSVTKEVFAGFDAFNPKPDFASAPIKVLATSNNIFKKLVTSLNPFFLVRNVIRDFQDAGINTKYFKSFFKNYARAVYHLSHNTKEAQLYRAMGGLSSSVFENGKGYVAKQSKMGFAVSNNKLKSIFSRMENLNMFVEQIPRFAEFLSSIEAGNSPRQAILDAADVTTNFGRTGKITKSLNSTIIPFLNPAIQGLSKITRNVKQSFTSVRAFSLFSVKLALIGVIPQIFNQLMYEDDEEYEELKDTDKENNYLFKVGDLFVKIPKGRVVSVIAGAVNRTSQEIEGKDADWKDYLDNVISQVTPVENFARPVWAPIQDVINNRTWYGSEIEGQQFENVRKEDRYDESTSSIAIALGKAFNYSPKKIHYLIDQYSGVIGDFLIPFSTQKAENSLIKGNFTIDPVNSNSLSNDFYKLYEEAQYLKTDGDVTAKYQIKYLNSVKSAVSEMYDEKNKIQQSSLSNAEKLQQTRVIQAMINEAYRNAINGYENYTEAITSTQGLFDEETEEKLRHAEITRLVFGAEKALEEYNSDVYEKCKNLNGAGISYDTLYAYYFATKGIVSDIDTHGNTIIGSKRKKIVSVINSLNLSNEQKLLLIASNGYTIQDGDVRGWSAATAKKRLLRHILYAKGLTQEQKAALAEACGFTVKNGVILTKF